MGYVPPPPPGGYSGTVNKGIHMELKSKRIKYRRYTYRIWVHTGCDSGNCSYNIYCPFPFSFIPIYEGRWIRIPKDKIPDDITDYDLISRTHAYVTDIIDGFCDARDRRKAAKKYINKPQTQIVGRLASMGREGDG